MRFQPIAVRTLVLFALAAPAAVCFADMSGPMNADEIKWGPAPPVLPAGAKMAVLTGDPAGNGFVTVRLKMPAGYKIPPHWHPTDEHVTVLSGSLAIGMGDTLDKKQSKLLKVGGYGVAPANMHHFAWTPAGATIELSLMGPLQVTYVNPADDPSAKK